ncbi:hypothetical protein L202_06114 [Cryptococcus amylolentus CBS 6039]|uniref:Uncharacterized protein n=2 Tax=Cryptococcus amylolentus TaxID=104669 RepID=A0A1E3HIM6_9TREE|nr:hypothetical protein L202_06114 [Cryptococcus amylolentus CBS 6039]ODN76193.1 hypothetical protein L202_06114 [Cryptococcus amylolentus CBS 6039]ODN96323.1 hypothetical protein I350_08347 [Cryptococcus amylolentus CBS 6273]
MNMTQQEDPETPKDVRQSQMSKTSTVEGDFGGDDGSMMSDPLASSFEEAPEPLPHEEDSLAPLMDEREEDASYKARCSGARTEDGTNHRGLLFSSAHHYEM